VPVSRKVADRVKALEREARELRQANEILRKASAYSAQAKLDCPSRDDHVSKYPIHYMAGDWRRPSLLK
jgi:hypothetical protein